MSSSALVSQAGSGLDIPQAGSGLDAAAREELRRALDRLEAGRGVIVRVADLMGSAVGGLTRLGARGLPGWLAGTAAGFGQATSGWATSGRATSGRATSGRAEAGPGVVAAARLAAPAGAQPVDGGGVAVAGPGPAGLDAGLGPSLQARMRGVAEAALARAYDVAILGLARGEADPRRAGRRRRAAVVASGAVGGFAGMAGFVPDATLTTLSIMREIAAIARQEGEDLASASARRACLEVFALRSPGRFGVAGGESELGYFSARLLMQGRPMMMLAREVAARYGVTLSRKFALQAMPVAGALGGAALNAAFLSHYRDLARAHFTIRRLERQHGAAAVQQAAGEMRAAMAG